VFARVAPIVPDKVGDASLSPSLRVSFAGAVVGIISYILMLLNIAGLF
jgi:hypothetical protein